LQILSMSSGCRPYLHDPMRTTAGLSADFGQTGENSTSHSARAIDATHPANPVTLIEKGGLSV